MNEVEKMYSNAVGKQSYCTANDCLDMSKCEGCYFCKRMHSPFTAEKQLELIKWIACNKINECKNIDFGEVLAELINSFWQDLTEEEKETIRGILRA